MAVKKSELYSILWEACNKLRGGVEPSRYKDYVLVLLFFKYVSDRYKGKRFAEFKVNEGASFDDLVKAKGKSDVGERVDVIIQQFLEDNRLKGLLPDVSFNNPDELGKGKELVDKVSGLIAVFENPAIDFKSNVASGDDIIGDAYEYFMMKFAQESGKSKGQFYTPSEVSRTIARLIGIGNIKQETGKRWTLHDPAAGSGSLLIRAADEAPLDDNGASIVDIFGQEKYSDTAGLAKMNFILHNKGTSEIISGNTLSDPQYTDDFGELRKFDFIVMNPPFSDKDWSDGIKPSEDKFRRFDGYGIPPEKNGDYAWFLHVLKALNSTGKAGIILPHGILFRGNAEETIRKEILKRKYIKGIVSLPGNLFYGTGIPACIIVIDKEKAEEREGIFFIDASQGFKKDGSKNRLREQDIEKIIQTFNNRIEIEGYSRFVSNEEIKKNDGNLNVPRYIQKVDKSLPQNIASHLKGGIPERDIESLTKLWSVSPELKDKIFRLVDADHNVYELAMHPEAVEEAIYNDANIVKESEYEKHTVFDGWKNKIQTDLLTIDGDTSPKVLIREISHKLLTAYEDVVVLDNYDVYDCLLNYWNEKLQDDVYVIKALGYEAGREIEYEYRQKKVKDDSGETIQVDDKTKVKSFDGALIPREIIEREYFSDALKVLEEMKDKAETIRAELQERIEEESGEDSIYQEVLNEAGDNITKTELNKRIKELDEKRISEDADLLEELFVLFTEDIDKAEKFVLTDDLFKKYDLRNKNGKLGKAKIQNAIKEAKGQAELPEKYLDEYEALISYKERSDELDAQEKSIKEVEADLDEKVTNKYGDLSVDEIKRLLFDEKWMTRLASDIAEEMDLVLNETISRVITIAKRYDKTLSEIEKETEESREKVRLALERMGYQW
ncbi:MAG TPA: N-6 DNA methylase [Clostridiales bacterium]|nr:N-6 DNA methylase [Clostridiales bacterium]